MGIGRYIVTGCDSSDITPNKDGSVMERLEELRNLILAMHFGSPSASPSISPSASPSVSPSASPSASPSVSPSGSPSISPSTSPSVSPSVSPSESPSGSPSVSPSGSPSASPSESPSLSPSASASPSVSPSGSPSVSPSMSPSLSPSASVSPSMSPSLSPSASVSPSVSPSGSPSVSPSMSPSLSPSASVSPSASPSASPSVSPSISPSAAPWDHASSYVITNGAFGSGILVYTHVDDTNYLVLNDAATTPGLNIDFTFGEDAAVSTSELTLHMVGNYNGVVADSVLLQQYNYNTTAWDNVTGEADDFPHNTSLQTYGYPLINDANHISGGQIKIRFNHAALGVITHTLTIDYMYLTTP